MSQNNSYRWALPSGIEVPPDRLRVRLDIYEETILLHELDDGQTTTRAISALDVARAFTRDLGFTSGILPEGALWWGTGSDTLPRKGGTEVALWRPPRVWQVALQEQAFQPPRRLALPMPGLVFICQPGKAPSVYAAKRRPVTTEDVLYHAPLFNVFRDGRSCQGTVNYPESLGNIPEWFFASFFTVAGDHQGRSQTCKDLRVLWESLDGKRQYPMGDLVEWGQVDKAMGGQASGDEVRFGV